VLAFGDSITFGLLASDYAATAYVPLVAFALGLGSLGSGYTNYAVGGVAMNAPPGTSIFDQMMGVAVPSRYETCVMVLGTNDIAGAGTDPANLAAFKVSMQQGLLYLTSHRRAREPRTERERWQARTNPTARRATIGDGCRVFVGTTPRQSIPYAFSGSPAAQALYVAAITDVVATVAAQGRRVYVVNLDTAYDPDTMSDDAPSHVHPNNTGHAAIAAAFLAQIRAHP
jgi:lysophospholipase L1-like esterase